MRSGKKMRIIGGIASLAVVAAVVVAAPVFARESGKGSGKANVFVGKMTGGMEVPPAEPTATARAVITLKPSSDTVCFRLHWDGLTSVAAAHIHLGDAGVTGSVVVPFFSGPIPDSITSVGGCVHNVDPALIQDIHDNPSGYYVNVHDAAFPGGAVRDQLHPAGKHDDD
ncbi:MAG TPA: CHRD domain-containing protein [Actinomycetota bacterium]|jgi:hypothetical protein